MIDQVGEVGELNHYELTELLVGKEGKDFWFRYLQIDRLGWIGILLLNDRLGWIGRNYFFSDCYL